MNVYKSILTGRKGGGGEVSIDSFEITTLLTKTEYLTEDNIDLKGMVDQ